MIKSQVGRRYSKAIFEIAEEKNQVKEIYEMLNSAMVLYRTDKEFKNFILNPLIDNEQKKSVLNEIFGKDNSENLNILLYILDKGRMNCIKYIVAEYLKIYYRKNRILDVKATFTKELTDEQKKKLIDKLSQKTGKEINLEIKIDKNILGGGIIKIGDKIIDGSIRRELDNWRKS
ncbi:MULTISPECIES: ATP synthase F1 subunit delta [Fusobacterium]|jgi:ATP synthase F1, delta subunit|uniref:ATP synthase subunit delta n=3 Tax=Fusobacterium TaxID=848 RepID=A0AAC9A1T3_9FUSO|nr:MULTISPECIES: ATP synthase F1 subunit delta [Fusobacterium]ALQ36395.1 ATP synthase subunit delta [Fusobacterium hwasookii ChDC F206]ALQ37014.1 ATP synthase subunit delta [Fusobacterium hwasookii ChDC F300]EJU07541.1 ATP synthase subunit delta [Fusobacterium hwasookii ChDC F128]PHH97860.1 ATP synthase F1 subunit delta [Fusobacterium polymorphum]QNE65693.1 ATP synthase F1 subunit delta [Fusobacterium hwasookii]